MGLGLAEAGSGHRGVPVVFTNSSPRPCRLHGYPVVEALNDDGVPVARAEHTASGYLGGLGTGTQRAVVPMAPGASASAMVETLAFDKTDGSACTAYAAVRVTVPGAGGSTALPWTSDGCGSLEVHPIVPGTDGRAP